MSLLYLRRNYFGYEEIVDTALGLMACLEGWAGNIKYGPWVTESRTDRVFVGAGCKIESSRIHYNFPVPDSFYWYSF